MKNQQLINRSAFITGANGGMGLGTTKLLAKAGIGRIVMAARTESKAETAKTALLEEVEPLGKIEAAGGFDMNQPRAIEAAVAALANGPAFDLIFFQVGGVIFTDDYQYLSYEGMKIEKTVFQNVIGAYITLQNLQKHNLVAPQARIVFAGGEGARGINGLIDKPTFASATALRNYLYGYGDLPKYNPMNAIGVSKLAAAWLTQKLASQDDGNTYLWFSPGLTHGTNGLNAVPPLKRFFMEKIAFGITGLLGLSQSPLKGAQKYLASLLGEIGQNGEVLGAPEGKALGKITDQKSMNDAITDQSLIEEFWTILHEVYPLESVEMGYY